MKSKQTIITLLFIFIHGYNTAKLNKYDYFLSFARCIKVRKEGLIGWSQTFFLLLYYK